MTIEPHTGDARAIQERRFEFCCMGNFAGHEEERPQLTPMPVNVNRWDQLFSAFKPACEIWLHFDGVSDYKAELQFKSLRDFRPKGLTQMVSLLANLRQLGQSVASANENEPVDVTQFIGADFDWLRELAGQTADEGFVDLLSMVDLGEDEESGLYLKYLKAFFAKPQYDGNDRSRVQGDIRTVEQQILEQITKDANFRQLEGTWRGVYAILDSFGDSVKLSAIDCSREELCDAFYLNYMRPETGEPLPIDLAFTTCELDHHGPSLHILHHLGRMAHHLSVPFIFNAAPELLGAKGYAHLGQITDISGKLRNPAHIKWRKLRDEEGAEWLYAALNPWRVNERDEAKAVWSPPALYVAGLMARRLAKGKWPGELLGATGTWDLSDQTAANLSDAQAIDYAYEGIGVLGAKPIGCALMGMNMLADVKLSGPESLEAANFVDYTLPYRFFVGCASRYFVNQYLGQRDNAEFADYLGLADAEQLTFEEADGQLICRFQAPFTIYATHADMVIGAVLEQD